MLDWTADPPGRSPEVGLRALRTLVLAHWATQAWAWVIRPDPLANDLPGSVYVAAAVWLTASCVAAFTRRARQACVFAVPVAFAASLHLFPMLPNHTGLAFLVLALFACFEVRGEDGQLLSRSLRWMTVLVLVWAGLQKVLNGYYFQGEFLTWMVAHGPDLWSQVFGWILPAEELARLEALPAFAPGVGPYRAESPLMVLVANTVWIGEILLGLGMLWRPTRSWAALGALALVCAIQLAPREWMFALIFVPMLLFFLPGVWLRRLLPFFILIDLILLVVLAGGPGESIFIKAWGTL